MSAIPKVQTWSAVLWPSFVVAGAANSLFFTVFDPQDLLLHAGLGPMSDTGVYSVGFFAFWFICALSGWLTGFFMRPCPRVEACQCPIVEPPAGGR